MKLIKMSLITIFTISSVVAGGFIEDEVVTIKTQEIEEIPKIPKVANSDTTIKGTAKLNYYTNDSVDLLDSDSSSAAASVTLDVSHKVFDGVSANFSMLGFTEFGESVGKLKMEQKDTGAILNVANLTATYSGTTLVAGRQLLNSPMAGSFDHFLAPSAFEAYTLINNSFNNLVLIGSFVDKFRPNNSGDDFIILDGDNYAFGGVYNNAFSSNLWFYNVEAGEKYQQFYADAGYDISGVKMQGQFVSTDYEVAEDSKAYGMKISSNIKNINLSAAYSSVQDRETGMIEVDSTYTSSWNTWASQIVSDSFKLEASTNMNNLSATISYADYDKANELDIILGYKVSNNFSLDAVYTSTEYTPDSEAEDTLEIVTTYKF